MASAAQSIELKMVVTPATGFASIDRAMSDLGLAKGPDTAVTPPILASEPEFAYWVAPDDDAQIHYSFNPVVFLRMLAFSGPAALRWRTLVAERLPHLEPGGIGALLRAEAPRKMLLGLYAAAELKAIDVLPDVESLRVHVDQRISRTAAQTAEKLALALLEVGAGRLEEEQRRHPGRSVLFAHLGDAAARREILLWLLRDADEPNADVVKVLRTALADAEWRVRITAMLVAARMKVSAVWQEIRRMEMPGSGPKGLDRRHHSLLAAVRKAVLAELAGEPRQAPNDERPRLMLHLRAVISGEEDGIRDEPREWIEAWLDAPAPDPAQHLPVA